jgi:hypothetical protein
MSTTRKRAAERGSALIISLLALLCLTIIGGLFVANTKTETQIAGHEMRSSQALYHAEGGCAESLARMSSRDSTYIGEPGHTWNPGWGRYIVLADGNSSGDPDQVRTLTDGLDNDADGETDEDDETYPEVTTAQMGSEVNYPWVRVSYKLNPANQILRFGDHDLNPATPAEVNLDRGFPIIIATAQGAQGSSQRLIEIEAVKPPFMIPRAATYSEDDDFTFNGTQFLVSGRDWDPDTGLVIPGNPEVPGIITTGDPQGIADGLSGQQQNNVEGSGGEPSVRPSPTDMDLQAMADQYLPEVNFVVPGGTVSDPQWGTVDDYKIVHVTGDLHASGSGSGGGVLIIDEDFDCTGSFTWYGIVIVMGDIRFSGGGSEIHIYGSLLVQGGGGQDQTVSGQADILYSSIALDRLTGLGNYRTYSWREL